jgi:hypothetical protein
MNSCFFLKIKQLFLQTIFHFLFLFKHLFKFRLESTFITHICFNLKSLGFSLLTLRLLLIGKHFRLSNLWRRISINRTLQHILNRLIVLISISNTVIKILAQQSLDRHRILILAAPRMPAHCF